MTIHKILKYLAIVIGVVGLILLGRIIMAGDDAIVSSNATQQSVVTPFLWLSYIVMAVVLVLIIFFVIKGLFKGDIKRTLIAVGSFLLIVLVAYLVTEGTQKTLRDGEILTANTDHWVGTGLVTFYILAAIAVGAMVLSGIRKLVK